MEDITFDDIYFPITGSSFMGRFIEAATYLSASSTFSFVTGTTAGGDRYEKLLINSASLDSNSLLSNSEVSFDVHNVFYTSSAISQSFQIDRLSGLKYTISPLIEIFRTHQSASVGRMALANDGSFFKCYFEDLPFTSSYYITRVV